MLLVFDLDGTVIDSTRALLQAHEAAWTSLGLQRPPDAAILELIGLPLVQTMRMLAPDQDPEAWLRPTLLPMWRHRLNTSGCLMASPS
jgi:phosphoglycolate phosphatase-like HAD superfamily hydrolase